MVWVTGEEEELKLKDSRKRLTEMRRAGSAGQEAPSGLRGRERG